MDKFKSFLQSEWFVPFLRFCVFIALLFVLFIALCGIGLSGSNSYSVDTQIRLTTRYIVLALGAVTGLVINAR